MTTHFQVTPSLPPQETCSNLRTRGDEQHRSSETESYIQSTPQDAKTYYHLGQMLSTRGQWVQALKNYQQAIALQAHYPEAYHDMGNLWYAQHHLNEALTCYQCALTLDSNNAQLYHNIGTVYYEQGHFEQALIYFQRALDINPHEATTYTNLGAVLSQQKKWQEAIVCYQQALKLMPHHAQTYHNLGIAFYHQYQLTQAIVCYQHALALEPNLAQTHLFLGNALQDKGMIEEALQAYRQILQANALNLTVQSSLAFTLNYSLNTEAPNIFLEHRKVDEYHALPLAHLIEPHRNRPDPQKRLKIAYVSPDFYGHPVALFMEPILAHHHHDQFEIFCFYNQTIVDVMTQCLQAYADHWIECAPWSDEQFAQQLRELQIDILIDLAGHTAHHRLLTFARKPAPIQVTYLGYPNTTGLTAIDYRITDHYVDCIGINDHLNSETPIKLPGSFFCYQAYSHTPPINTLPALEKGYLTWGSLNKHQKINPFLLNLWAQILKAVPHSRLIVQMSSFKDLETQQAFQIQMQHLGIDKERLTLNTYLSAPKHLETYHHVDIALDSYPFNGGTTTCEALWMGVPVVTLVGERQVSRMGLSILSTVGLPQLIAYTPQEYVNICLQLANNLNYLQALRTEMRDRMWPLMDAATFTHHLESAYRKMWIQWCAINS